MFSQAEWTAEIQHPIFVKLYSELNAFSVFLLEKTPTVWVKSSTVKLHNDGCFFQNEAKIFPFSPRVE